mmetsp:Transcript_77323/g.151427  ORF Transcript_77323/g.151427 Transcript_77323/m.151427 type:complete len:88 (+) Transcript_77323:70-333(+)
MHPHYHSHRQQKGNSGLKEWLAIHSSFQGNQCRCSNPAVTKNEIITSEGPAIPAIPSIAKAGFDVVGVSSAFATFTLIGPIVTNTSC